MAKRLSQVDAAKAEATKFGASLELDRCRKHIVGIVKLNGKQRKVFISVTPSDGARVAHNVREDVRRKIREMQAC